MESVIMRIKVEYHNLTKNEQAVADYILAHPIQAAGFSIQELATATFSSNSNISRFVKKIKLNNFRELRIELAKDIHLLTRHLHQEKPDQLFNDLIDESIMTLYELGLMLNDHEIERIIELLYQADRIDFYGRGVSNIVAQDCHQKFLNVKRFTHSYSDPSMHNTGAATLTIHDVAIFFSYSGQQEDLLETMRIAKIAGAAVILVTKYKGEINLKHDVDYIIHLPNSAASDDKVYYTASRLAMMQVADILYIGYIKKYKDSLKQLSKSEALTHW